MAHDFSRNLILAKLSENRVFLFSRSSCRRGRGCVLVLRNSDERRSNLLFQVDRKTQWPADKHICALYENFKSRKLK